MNVTGTLVVSEQSVWQGRHNVRGSIEVVVVSIEVVVVDSTVVVLLEADEVVVDPKQKTPGSEVASNESPYSSSTDTFAGLRSLHSPAGAVSLIS
jgi:hypothetical protein